MTDDIKYIDTSLVMLKKLEDVLDVFGAEPLKWPEEERSRLLTFIGSDKKALELFNEAQALDFILGTEASTKSVTDDLHAKILASLPQKNYEDNVTRLTFKERPEEKEDRFSFRDVIQSGTLLAASLIIGVFIGLTDFVSMVSSYGHNENIDITSILENDTESDIQMPPEEGFL